MPAWQTLLPPGSSTLAYNSIKPIASKETAKAPIVPSDCRTPGLRLVKRMGWLNGVLSIKCVRVAYVAFGFKTFLGRIKHLTQSEGA